MFLARRAYFEFATLAFKVNILSMRAAGEAE